MGRVSVINTESAKEERSRGRERESDRGKKRNRQTNKITGR